MTTGAVFEAVAQVRDGVDGLLSGGLSSIGDVELVGLLEDLEVQRRRLDAVDARLLAEVDQRRTAGDYGRSSTADLLAHRLRVAPGEAKARVDRARDLGPRHGLTGEPLPPILPATSAALRAGDISAAHTTVISRALDAIRADIAVDAAGPAEAFLVDAARHEDPARLRHSAAVLLARLDPLSAPAPGEDGEPDPRTPAQRRQDALRDAALRLLRAGTLPESGGVPVTVLVTTTAADLHDPAGIGRTGHGQLITLRRLLSLADSEIRYTTMTITGEILHHGRAKRIATPAQRRAMAARDGGCSFPGCDRPAARAEAHHILAWLDGGLTDIDNLCLVCPFHHRLLDHGDWQITMLDGRPRWLPPPWLDPERTPMVNTAHHPPDIDFGNWDRQRPDTG